MQLFISNTLVLGSSSQSTPTLFQACLPKFNYIWLFLPGIMPEEKNPKINQRGRAETKIFAKYFFLVITN